MPTKYSPKERIAQFWKKIDARGPDECWLWTAARRSANEPVVWWDGRFVGAHRIMWQLAHGAPPDGHYVLRRCGNDLCCNPAHLYTRPYLASDEVERFWSCVSRQSDGCWEWALGRKEDGYGRTLWHGRLTYAHRIAWELTYGPVPDGLCVLHRCDNPACCNPTHLWLGSRADNNHDRDIKGRQPPPKGDMNGRAVLSRADVAEIRQRHTDGTTQSALAQMFCISRRQIQRIVRNESWT